MLCSSVVSSRIIPTLGTPRCSGTYNSYFMSRFQGKTLSLREFLTRSETLKLYRDILRALRRIDSVGDRQQLTEWARSEFQQTKNETDPESIKMHLTRGRVQLKNLEETLGRAR